MSQSRKEEENRLGTPFPRRGADDWELKARNQLDALRVRQQDQQGENQSQRHPTAISRPASNIPLMHPTPIRVLSDQRSVSFDSEPFQRPRAGVRNLTDGVWIDNENRTRIAPHIHSPTHIGPSPLGRDYDMEMLAAMMATAFQEKHDVTNATVTSEQNVYTESRGQADGSGNGAANSHRGDYSNLGIGELGDEMEQS
ncbi:hypothetical protein Plec18170_006991 [Paecilomyces lecythidis]